jgi:glycosyltransferase involved in cell wall biosynthesis
MYLSIIIPVKDEEKSLEPLHNEILESLKKLELDDYEILFIDDGSKDESWNVIDKISKINSKVKGYKLIKNYGKSIALDFSFRKAKGDFLITMDADLQDDPEEIGNLLNQLNKSDCVIGWKKIRHDPLVKTIPSKIFNFVCRKIFKLDIHDINCGLKGFKKKVYEKLVIYGELHRFIPIIVNDNGFSVSEIIVNHRQRKFGKSKFGVERIMRGLIDFLTISFTRKFHQRPNHFFGTIGLFLITIGGLMNLYLIFLWLFNLGPIGGRPLLFFSILMIIVGIQILSIGIIAEMILKVNQEKKNNIDEIDHKETN